MFSEIITHFWLVGARLFFEVIFGWLVPKMWRITQKLRFLGKWQLLFLSLKINNLCFLSSGNFVVEFGVAVASASVGAFDFFTQLPTTLVRPD